MFISVFSQYFYGIRFQLRFSPIYARLKYGKTKEILKGGEEMHFDFSDFKTDQFMFVVAGIVVLFVLADSIFFLVRAVRRGKELGVSGSTMKQTATQAALFSIPGAIAIVMTIVALSGALGIVLPWIRLSVIGSVTYEVPAAITALEAVGAKGGLAVPVTDPKAFATAAWVMTTGSVLPLVIAIFLTRHIQNVGGRAENSGKKNKVLTGALSGAAFIGLMAAFAAKAITGVGDKAILGDGAGLLSISALVVSVGVMLLLMHINKKHPNHWLETLSMPIAMFAAMLVVCILGKFLPTDIAMLEWRY